MNIDVRTDITRVAAYLDDAGKLQIPFAFSLALNRTAEEAQLAVKQRIEQRGFRVRSAQSAAFLEKQVQFFRGEHASKDNLVARIRVSSGFGAETPGKSFLPFFEAGGVRSGARLIGLPVGPTISVPVRATPMEIIPRALFPVYLGLKQRRLVKGGFTVPSAQGKARTFLLPAHEGVATVFQRFGSGKRDIKAIFFEVPSVQVAGRQYFYETMRKTVADRLRPNFLGFLEFALRTAK